MAKENLEIPKKLMICLRKEGRKGKTGTIKALTEILMPNPAAMNTKWHEPDTPPKNWKEWPWDICVATKAKGKFIGLCSFGDIPGPINSGLEFLGNQNCDIIFCACRTKGATVQAVRKKAKKFGYTIVWTSPYVDNAPPKDEPTQWQKYLNTKKAKHLEDFI